MNKPILDQLIKRAKDGATAIAEIRRLLEDGARTERDARDNAATAVHYLTAILALGWPDGTTGPAIVREARAWLESEAPRDREELLARLRAYGETAPVGVAWDSPHAIPELVPEHVLQYGSPRAKDADEAEEHAMEWWRRAHAVRHAEPQTARMYAARAEAFEWLRLVHSMHALIVSAKACLFPKPPARLEQIPHDSP